MVLTYYRDFEAKNTANKQNFKNAVKTGQLNPNMPGIDPYMSITIVQVDKNWGDGLAEVKSSYQGCYTNITLPDLVSYVMNSNVIHVTNPSRIKCCFKYM